MEYGSTYSEPQSRQVGFPLLLGIIVLPYLFAWVLLNKGYSTRARVIGFAWMLIPLAIVFSQPKADTRSAATASTAPATSASAPQAPETPKVEESWLPEDYAEINERTQIIKSNVTAGFKFLKYGEYECPEGAKCQAVWIIPREPCDNLYVGFAALDWSGANVGFTNAMTSSVGAGQPAKMIVEHYGDARLEFKELSCY